MTNELKGSENYNESLPTCPYCGHPEEEWHEDMGERKYWGDYEKFECSGCEKNYYLMREISWHAKPSCELNKAACELEEMVIESPYKQCINCDELT